MTPERKSLIHDTWRSYRHHGLRYLKERGFFRAPVLKSVVPNFTAPMPTPSADDLTELLEFRIRYTTRYMVDGSIQQSKEVVCEDLEVERLGLS